MRDNLLAMLDPRIYRTALLVVLLAAVVLGFSLYDQQPGLGTSLAPDAFNGQNAFATMRGLAAEYPSRASGSTNDQDIAGIVSQGLRKYGFVVTRSQFQGQTANGPRTLQNVIGIRPGLTSGSIVIVSHRDAHGSPATAELSGTAVLLELARVLSGETQHRSVVLVSTSGSAGLSGTTQLSHSLPGPIDAVIVLGNLATTTVHRPIVVPWSNARVLAPPMLRNTLARSLSSQAGLAPGEEGLVAQLTHLAFPMTPAGESPFGAAGQPAVLLSLSGEQGQSPNAPTSVDRITEMGRSVLQTILALDRGPSAPAPSTYMLFDSKVVPAWAVRIFVLGLILPVLIATVDGLARARRRKEPVGRGVVWVLSTALPFVLGVLVILGLRLVGLISLAPPGPVAGGAAPLHGSGLAAIGIALLVVALAFVLLRPLLIKVGAAGGEIRPEGAGVALLLILCLTVLAIWIVNPFAALLLIPALHLWLWLVEPEIQIRRALIVLLVLAGLAAPVLAFVYYAISLGLSPVEAAWHSVLLIAGGDVTALSAIEWSIFLGCLLSTILIAVRTAREAAPEDIPVTVRGPVTYAGPGSLGGTESALRR